MTRAFLALNLAATALIAIPSPAGAVSGAEACEACHRLPATISHPVAMAPRMSVPRVFPLDESGRLTCASCHRPDDAASGHAPRDPLLRVEERGAAFCARCHVPDNDPSSRYSHALVTGRAHGEDTRSSRTSTVIDSLSLQCLGCHDGAAAPSADVFLAGIGTRVNGLHPIGSDYARAATTNPLLTPAASLSAAVRLVEGKVGCGSCHNPYSTEARRLVVSNRGSGLCRSCHTV